MKQLIIGSSASSMGAVFKLRTLGNSSSIICISASQEMPYNTCHLATYLQGAKKEEELILMREGFFKEKGLELRLETRLIAINTKLNRASLENSEGTYEERYDNLFLGMGTRPNLPEPAKQNLDGLFPFYTLRDANSIANYIQKNGVRAATIIGGGISGVECADALAMRGLKVAIVERGNRLLEGLIDRSGSEFVEKKIESFGVELIKNCSVMGFAYKNNSVNAVFLSNGRLLPSELVLFSTGSRPNVELPQMSGILTGSGIFINEYMQTNIPNIYAGGDIAMIKDLSSGEPIRSTLWSDALMQGSYAACAMSGSKKAYVGALPITSSRFFGISIASCGYRKEREFLESTVKRGEGFYYRYFVQKGALVGFIMLGPIDNLGYLRKAIVSKERFNIL